MVVRATPKRQALTTVVFLIMSALAYAQGPQSNVIYASHIAGVTLDCDLSTNFTGEGCTDNDAAINGVLATATAAHPITLMMDGATVTGGIIIPSTGNVAIHCTGWNSGFVLASGANSHLLRNIPAQNGLTWALTPGTPGQNVEIRDCRMNGNQPGAGTGAVSWQAPNRNWLFGLYLDNLAHVKIEHNWFYNVATYSIHCNSCTDLIVDNNRIDAVQQGPHQDGVHIDGPSNQIRITHNWFNNSDDAIGVNATEGYGGPIAGVIVDGNHCVGCLTAYRQLANEEGGATTNQQVSGVIVANGSGTIRGSNGVHGAVLRLGESYDGDKTADIMQDISVSNMAYATLDDTSVGIDVADNIGMLSVSNFHIVDPQGTAPFLHFYSGATISNLVCRACGVHRTASGNGNMLFAVIPRGDSITRLDLDYALTDQQGQSYPALPYLIDVQESGSIGSLIITSLDPTHSPTLLNGDQWSRIGALYGAGVSSYWRNTTFANLPPARYAGLAVSISDSNAGGVWGAIEGGGSAGHYAVESSNGVDWTVAGK